MSASASFQTRAAPGAPGSPGSSLSYLERHQGDLEEYIHNVGRSAAGRYGPAFWGLWDQRVAPAEDAVIVDLGAGTGALLRQLRARLPQARLLGVELHPAMAAPLRALGQELGFEVVEADLGHPLPLPAGGADVVTSVLSFHELPYPPALLDRAVELLRPGGVLLLHDIVKWPLAEYLQHRPLNPDTLQHYREHCLFRPDDLRHLVERAGLQVVDVTLHEGGRFATLVARAPVTA
jgi:SAM-dependent methyltransferase